jgi:hypothetical protein
MTEAMDKESEQIRKANVELQYASDTLNTKDSIDLLDIGSYQTGSICKESLVKSDNVQDPGSSKTMNAMSLFATLDTCDRKSSTYSPTNECLSQGDKSQSNFPETHTTESEICSSNRTLSTGMKPVSKSFTWSQNKFSFSKPKSVTSLDRSSAVLKDFKNPLKKIDSSPRHESQQVNDRSSASEVVAVSASVSSSLLVEEEGEEESVDHPSPVDSGIELDPLISPCQQAASFTFSDVSASSLFTIAL